MPQPEELPALRCALLELLEACDLADAKEELPLDIDGSLLDQAAQALELQYPVIWTADQVKMLEARQADTNSHTYTCGNRSNDARSLELHQAQADEGGDAEPGLLYPTVRGWSVQHATIGSSGRTRLAALQPYALRHRKAGR